MKLHEFKSFLAEQGSGITDRVQEHLKNAVEEEKGYKVQEFKLIGQGVHPWGIYFSTKLTGPLFGVPLSTDNIRFVADILDRIGKRIETEFVKTAEINLVRTAMGPPGFIEVYMLWHFRK